MDLRKFLKNEYKTIIMVNQKLKKIEYIKREILDVIGSLNLYSYEDLGNKKLCYDIKGENIAHYIKINFYGDNKIVKDLEELFRTDNNILKFLTIKAGEKKESEFSKQLYEILDIWTENSWEEEPLEEDEVNILIEILRNQLNLINGNITKEEYEKVMQKDL